jgi:hypothetical protein
MSYQGSFRKRADTSVSMANVNMNTPVIFKNCKVTTKVTSVGDQLRHLNIKEIREAIQSDFYVTVHSWFLRVFFTSMLVLLLGSMISTWYGVNHPEGLENCRDPGAVADDDSATDFSVLPEDVSNETTIDELSEKSTTWTLADNKYSTAGATQQADNRTTDGTRTTQAKTNYSTVTSPKAGETSTDLPESPRTLSSSTDANGNTESTHQPSNLTVAVTET